MSSTVQFAYPTLSVQPTVYLQVKNQAGQWWTGSTWGTFTGLAMAFSAGFYSLAFPAGIATAGYYDLFVTLQAGGSAASTDLVIGENSVYADASGNLTTADAVQLAADTLVLSTNAAGILVPTANAAAAAIQAAFGVSGTAAAGGGGPVTGSAVTFGKGRGR